MKICSRFDRSLSWEQGIVSEYNPRQQVFKVLLNSSREEILDFSKHFVKMLSEEEAGSGRKRRRG